MNCTIRNMIKSDIEPLSHGFMNQGWPGREEILARYFLEQESAEKRVKFVSSKVTLGIGLHLGYGPAQRLYIRRGYIPDGTGVWYRNQPLKMNATSQNNDDLVLYLVKEFG